MFEFCVLLVEVSRLAWVPLGSPVGISGSTAGPCPLGPRNSPSARAFSGLRSPNSVALVDHWHRPASGTRGLTVQTGQPGGSSIVICLWLWFCSPSPNQSLRLLIPPARLSHQPGPTQPSCVASSSLLTIQVSSPSPFPQYTLSLLPPTLAPTISLLLAGLLDSRYTY